MKDGWEIKKLREVCEIQTGKLDANAKVENGIYPFYTCDAKPYRIDTFAFDDEAILISGNGSLVGHVNYYKGKFNAYQRTYVLTTFNSFNIPFLVSYLKGYLRQYIYAQKKGGCIPYITLPILKNFAIPCPPLPEQERIVSELDCINGILEKKREQIKELDALAQSIFYHMFGDPVTNEKGWEVKKLGEVATSQIGLTYKPENVTSSDEGTIVLRSSNIQNSALAFEDIVRVDCEVKENKYVQDGDILMCSRNGSAKLVGKVARIKNLQERMSYGAFMTIIRSEYNDYLFEFFKLPAFRGQLTASQTATINQITVKMLADITIPLPPLSLQQSFATKIEAIEKQKELIKRSIAEVETLLASRMQHHFNS